MNNRTFVSRLAFLLLISGGINCGGRATPVGSNSYDAGLTGGISNSGTIGLGGATEIGGNAQSGASQQTGGGRRNTGGTVGVGGAATVQGSMNAGGLTSVQGGANTGGTTLHTTTIDAGGYVIDGGVCVPPCGANFQPNSTYSDFSADAGATLFFDFSSGQLILLDDPSDASPTAKEMLTFTYSSTEGYSVSTTGSYWIEFATNYEYSSDYTGYSLKLDWPITLDIVDVSTNQTIIVQFTLQQEAVTILDAHIAQCDSTKDATCQNPADCSNVEVGRVGALSSACAACYAAFKSCSTANCATECPGQGGNVCMSCQTNHACHSAFMACSGLDYMPPGTLTLPTP